MHDIYYIEGRSKPHKEIAVFLVVLALKVLSLQAVKGERNTQFIQDIHFSIFHLMFMYFLQYYKH